MDNPSAPLTVLETEVEPCRVKLDIEVPVERVRAAYKETANAFNRHGRVPGFRPGRVPQALLRRQYGSQIEKECRERLIAESLREVLGKRPEAPESPLRLEDEDSLSLSEDRPFVFSVSFDVAPKFQLPEYKGIRVSRQPAAVDDAQVEEAVASWLQRRTSFEKVDRPAQAGDMVKASWDATLPEGVAVPEGSRFYLTGREMWLALRDPELIPGCTAGLAGARAGETRELDVTFPADFFEPALAGRTAHYQFTVLEVHGSHTPELTDELARSAGAESAQQVRDHFRETLRAEHERGQDESVRQQILTALLSGLEMPLPPTRFRQTVYEAMLRLYDREIRLGTPHDRIAERHGELQRLAEEEARQRLRRLYVLRRIAEEEKIEPEPERVDRVLQLMAAQQGLSPRALLRRLEETGQVMNVVESVREAMVLNRLVELAQVSEKASQ